MNVNSEITMFIYRKLSRTIVGILTFLSRKNFMLSCVEYEKSFITLGPGKVYDFL